jgi:hypothetical protein
MDLRESLHAAAEEAPLATGTEVIDRAIARGRRSAAARNAGIAGVGLAAALATALVVPALSGGGQALGTRTSAGPPPRTTSAAPLMLTAADVAGLAAGQTIARRESPAGIVYLYLRNGVGGRDVDPASPCTLPAGASPGVNGAPTPEDQCTRQTADGVTFWVRRWGYSPQQRPWTSADSTIIDAFVPHHGQFLVLTISNTELPDGTVPPPTPGARGQKFDITFAELGAIVSTILQHRP